MEGWRVNWRTDSTRCSSLLLSGNTLLCPVWHSLSSHCLLKALLSLVTSRDLWSCLLRLCFSSRVSRPPPLRISCATCSTPEDPWQLRKFTSFFYFTTVIVFHFSPLTLVLPWLLLSVTSTKDKMGLWQLGQGCQFWLPRLHCLSLLPHFNLPSLDCNRSSLCLLTQASIIPPLSSSSSSAN